MLASFEPFLGTYRSVIPCEGVCPTGVSVQFEETFALRRGDEWVHYDQRAVEVSSGVTLHTESGVFRAGPNDTLEVSLVMNSGRLEMGVAHWEGAVLHTSSEKFFNDRLGVRGTARSFAFDADGCSKELFLATAVWPALTRHMWGRLERQDGDPGKA